MLTDIPHAKTYYLNPIKTVINPMLESKIMISDKNMELGGTGMINELANFIDDSQIVFIMGVTTDKCLIFVNMTDVECADLVYKTKRAYDVKVASVLGKEDT